MSNNSKVQPNYTYTIISVAMVLLLAGIVCGAWVYGKHVLNETLDKTPVFVELKDGTTLEDGKALVSEIKQSVYARPATVKYISKEAALAEMKAAEGADFLDADLQNPLSASISFNANKNFCTADSLLLIKTQLAQNESVAEVSYEVYAIPNMERNIRNLVLIGVGICLLFLIIAITLIHNTIRLSLYSDRFLIKNMELVGASWSFISRPYLWRSVRHGLLSAVMACSIMAAVGAAAWGNIPAIEQVVRLPLFTLIPIVIFALGILISVASTYFVVNRYLRMRIDDLY